MNMLEQGRDRLATALGGIIDQGDRVDPYEEGTAVPCIRIGTPALRRTTIDRNGAQGTTATYPVTVIVDGANRAQRQKLDEYVSRIWDAAWQVGAPSASRTATLDLGNLTASSRGQTIDIEVPVGPQSLCPPTPE